MRYQSTGIFATMPDRSKYKYFIGIDPGVTTGFSVWSKWDKKIRQIGSAKIHQVIDNIRYWHKLTPGQIFIRVEDARKANHGRNNEADKNKLKGAGSIMRDAKIWEDFLDDIGIDFEMVRPNKALTKKTAEEFKKLTGYTFSTNEHGRDAAMLVFGF